MIRKVKFSNFYSFDKEQEISFLAKKKKSYSYFLSKSSDQITKVAAFIGGNASGKTNVMRLFSFLSYFICESKKDCHEILFSTFFNNKKISNFYIEFEKESNIFYYQFSVRDNDIVSEKLEIKKIAKNSKKRTVFLRKKEIELGDEFFTDFPFNSLKNLRVDVSLIAFLHANYKIEIINTVYYYFDKIRTNINEQGYVNNPYYQDYIVQLYRTDKQLEIDVENFIRKFDVGLSGFEIKEDNNEGKRRKEFVINGIHKIKEKKEKLDFMYESRGTQSLFYTLINIISALKSNSIVIIDELETGFHPEALNKIISYFIDENKNRSAQMIFSSHSLGFMSQLDMHQIYLVEKSKNSQSSVFRLNQVEGIRTDDNFLAKYMSGAYGAFPDINI